MYVHVDILVYCIVRLAQVLWSDFIFMVTAVFISSNTPILYCPIITENYKGFFFFFFNDLKNFNLTATSDRNN